MCSLRNFITLHEISRNAARRFGYWILLASLNNGYGAMQGRKLIVHSPNRLVVGVHVGFSILSSTFQATRIRKIRPSYGWSDHASSHAVPLSQAVPSCPKLSPCAMEKREVAGSQDGDMPKKPSASYRLQILRLGCFRLWGFPKS